LQKYFSTKCAEGKVLGYCCFENILSNFNYLFTKVKLCIKKSNFLDTNSFINIEEFIHQRNVMKEQELNTIMGVISDPVHNVYKLNGRKDIEEIQRIIRIFKINEEQRIKHRMFSIKNLATLKLVLSNN